MAAGLRGRLLRQLKPLYLQPGLGLRFDKRRTAGAAFDEYVSDPAKPVPYVRRPVRWDDGDQWRYWLTTDQRHVDGRPDVLTYVTAAADRAAADRRRAGGRTSSPPPAARIATGS